MPAYGAVGTPVAIYGGDEVTLWAAETPAPGDKSMSVSLGAKAGSPSLGEVAISLQFAAAPTAVVSVQVANDDVDGDYVTLAGVASTNTSPDILQLATQAQFLRLLLTSQSAGGPITAKIRRAA